MLKMVFHNDAFVVFDKPSGMLTIPGRLGAKDPRPVLSVEVKRDLPTALPVHRLDEEVSGLVLFALTRQAHRAANRWFESREIHKFYEALTEGAPRERRSAEGELWESKLLRGKRRAYESPVGKLSRTRARWLKTVETHAGRAQLWQVEPLTGRSHQLRYELARHGWPILGDELYGARRPWQAGAIALRAVRLDFSEVPDAAAYGLPRVLEVKGLTGEMHEP